MRLLDRYLLRELLLPFGFCLSAFLLLWTAGKWAMDRKDEEYALRAVDVVQYYLVQAPEFIVLLLPIALLLALLYALNQHARHHELTAMRATGISLWRLSIPYFAVGLVASVALFVLNEWFVPDSEERSEAILRRGEAKKQVTERTLVRNFGFNSTSPNENRTWRVGSFNLATSEMTDLEIIQSFGDTSQRWVRAKRAVPGATGWILFDANEYRKDPGTNPLIPWSSTNMMAAPEFTETPAAIRSEIKINERLARLDNLKKLSRPDVPIADIVDYLRFHPNLPPEHGRWLYTALHGRLAAPLKCIVVILIALPFGAASGRRNIFMGVAGSIFIVIVYYFLQEFSIALGAGGYVPPWVGGWLPNIVFGLAGLWMTARVR